MFITPKRYTAFTLAEVLITLTIVGIIAAISIPSIINSTNDSQYKAMYKQAFSDLSSAFNRAKAESNLTPLSDHIDHTAMKANLAAIGNYFNKVKVCDGTDLPNCWDMAGELFLNGNPKSDSTAYSFIDSKGRAWSYRNYGVCYVIFVDINGFKKPNVYGKDRFPMLLAFQTHIDDSNAVWSKDYATTSGIPIKVHPLNDKSQNTNCSNGGCECGSSEFCYYKSWLSK